MFHEHQMLENPLKLNILHSIISPPTLTKGSAHSNDRLYFLFLAVTDDYDCVRTHSNQHREHFRFHTGGKLLQSVNGMKVSVINPLCAASPNHMTDLS